MSDAPGVPQVIEFQGRLPRSDRRPASPGRYDLLFRLHATEAGDAFVWEERQTDVEVMPGGFFNVVLGEAHPLDLDIFDDAQLWLSVRVVRVGVAGDEYGARVPMAAAQLRLAARVARLEERISLLEATLDDDGGGGRDKLVNRLTRLREWLDELRERVGLIEGNQDLALVRRRVETISGRLDDMERDAASEAAGK